MTPTPEAKRITNKVWLSHDQAESLARDIDAALAQKDQEIERLTNLLKIYDRKGDSAEECNPIIPTLTARNEVLRGALEKISINDHCSTLCARIVCYHNTNIARDALSPTPAEGQP